MTTTGITTIATVPATATHTIHITADCYGWDVIIELTAGELTGHSAVFSSHSSEAKARAAANREYARLRRI